MLYYRTTCFLPSLSDVSLFLSFLVLFSMIYNVLRCLIGTSCMSFCILLLVSCFIPKREIFSTVLALRLPKKSLRQVYFYGVL
jgi:hypothetical protein